MSDRSHKLPKRKSIKKPADDDGVVAESVWSGWRFFVKKNIDAFEQVIGIICYFCCAAESVYICTVGLKIRGMQHYTVSPRLSG